MTFKERYNKLKEEHRCVGCGAKLPDEYTMISASIAKSKQKLLEATR